MGKCRRVTLGIRTVLIGRNMVPHLMKKEPSGHISVATTIALLHVTQLLMPSNYIK